MHSLCVVLIAGLGCLVGMSDVNDAKRNMCIGEAETLLKVALYPSLRISAAPYCAKSEVNGTEKDVLDSSRAILYPILGHRSGQGSLGIAAYYDNER